MHTEYGGPGCGAHCFPHATIGPNSHTVLLSNALSGMCSLLCQNNLVLLMKQEIGCALSHVVGDPL
ncbi:hypothetical protein Bhyg_06560 [Pseudolycoriella hygida]|uniref:Uncharacterized protein n=1 Tax=Pseudolycoriella hygida TaxID=35572 RepID=A0A9Q0S2Y6_9DIPT|nr:hypothetical protein Bhyg_06560 [Pseudolycoriella hygida]